MERNNMNEHEGLPLTGEQGERLVINSVVIPADEDEPLRGHELAPSGLAERQALVGGAIEGLTLDGPPARLLMNEDGKLLRLPINRRATLLAWMHDKRIRYGDVLVGDVVLLGYPDDEGLDTSVPDELDRVFSSTHLRVETQLRDGGGWQTPARRSRFDDWLDAYDYALRLGHVYHQSIADVRVVPEE